MVAMAQEPGTVDVGAPSSRPWSVVVGMAARGWQGRSPRRCSRGRAGRGRGVAPGWKRRVRPRSRTCERPPRTAGTMPASQASRGASPALIRAPVSKEAAARPPRRVSRPPVTTTVALVPPLLGSASAGQAHAVRPPRQAGPPFARGWPRPRPRSLPLAPRAANPQPTRHGPGGAAPHREDVTGVRHGQPRHASFGTGAPTTVPCAGHRSRHPATGGRPHSRLRPAWSRSRVTSAAASTGDGNTGAPGTRQSSAVVTGGPSSTSITVGTATEIFRGPGARCPGWWVSTSSSREAAGRTPARLLVGSR